jgi:hypothetical protein
VSRVQIFENDSNKSKFDSGGNWEGIEFTIQFRPFCLLVYCLKTYSLEYTRL